MTPLERIGSLVVRAVMGPIGLLFGVLSVVGLAIAAAAGPVAGLLSWLAMPFRALARHFGRPPATRG